MTIGNHLGLGVGVGGSLPSSIGTTVCRTNRKDTNGLGDALTNWAYYTWLRNMMGK